MNEQFESIKSPEKSAEQLYEELNQAFDEFMKLIDQVHELEVKAGKDGLSREEFESIVDERNRLAAQRDEKWEDVKKLEEEWNMAEDREISKLEKEYKKLEE
ncbi:MAG: hypothetical protein COV69_02160 [Parcubacteria group bacterium CG11_big_fil_rev_8_21_14_0_20_39_14]|nr:MAG: hypothetical protein COV69_02160 [Parcubacteria group bacterium CG11_big_fil_rev_8_21_14_0_20_39_14]